MKLIVVDTNFLSYPIWKFKLSNETGEEYYIMDTTFYKHYNLKDPVTRTESDSLDKGHWIDAIVERINGINVVTRFHWRPVPPE